MPPKVKITSKDIVTASIVIVREQGIDAVNARAIAARLGCSIQPVFRTFGTMDDLKVAVFKRAEDIYNGEMAQAIESGGFKGLGLAYIGFARRERNLFKLLFMTDTFRGQNAADIAGSTKGDDEVVELISNQTSLSTKKARELYSSLWFTAHGIASLLAANASVISDEDAGRILNNIYEGLVKTL